MSRMPSGRLVHVQAQSVADLLYRRLGRLHVQLHLSAQKLGRQVSDDEVGVGHGRLRPSLAVAGGPRVSAGRLRPHPKRPSHLRHVGDRAAPGAHRANVHARHLDRDDLAGKPPAVGNLRLPLDRHLPVLAESDVRGGPTHVEGEDVLVACAAGDVECPGDASGWAGEYAVDRVLRRYLSSHETGIRTEQIELPGHSDLFHGRLEVANIGLHSRPHIGVEAGSEGALVLAELGENVGGDGDGKAGVELLDDVADLTLVGGVGVGVNERHGQRLHARLDEIPYDLPHLLPVDGDHDFALSAHPLPRFPGVLQGGGRVGLDHDDPSGEWPRRLRAGEMEDLPEALGRDQTYAGSLGLQHRVRRHRRPMLEEGNLLRRDA